MYLRSMFCTLDHIGNTKNVKLQNVFRPPVVTEKPLERHDVKNSFSYPAIDKFLVKFRNSF